MIETSWLTNDERSVLSVALADYRERKLTEQRKAAKAADRNRAHVGAYVAGELIRQIAGR